MHRQRGDALELGHPSRILRRPSGVLHQVPLLRQESIGSAPSQPQRRLGRETRGAVARGERSLQRREALGKVEVNVPPVGEGPHASRRGAGVAARDQDPRYLAGGCASHRAAAPSARRAAGERCAAAGLSRARAGGAFTSEVNGMNSSSSGSPSLLSWGRAARNRPRREPTARGARARHWSRCLRSCQGRMTCFSSPALEAFNAVACVQQAMRVGCTAGPRSQGATCLRQVDELVQRGASAVRCVAVVIVVACHFSLELIVYLSCNVKKKTVCDNQKKIVSS